jgi:hypothetical protein
MFKCCLRAVEGGDGVYYRDLIWQACWSKLIGDESSLNLLLPGDRLHRAMNKISHLGTYGVLFSLFPLPLTPLLPLIFRMLCRFAGV